MKEENWERRKGGGKERNSHFLRFELAVSSPHNARRKSTVFHFSEEENEAQSQSSLPVATEPVNAEQGNDVDLSPLLSPHCDSHDGVEN